MKPEPLVYGERKVYTVSAFNRGVASWLERLPTVWVEGEVTELRRQPGWQSVFFTLKDQRDGSCLAVSMPRAGFDALRLELADGVTVHVFGRPELFEARATFRLRALTIEPLGLGALLAGIERLKRRLTAEGAFASARKRPLPVFPRRIALLTGPDAAAKRDFVTAVAARFPPARVLVAETAVQGPRAAQSIAATLSALAREPEVDVVVLARGGGSFEDLLPFSDERVVRAV
ncbi:MAG: exodeoxyribonuclease VII large subunit, partial [Actinomycetota bacterium]|nr:exodeoxyribonuclease VII large subunit [Actinomycetota bacterium]